MKFFTPLTVFLIVALVILFTLLGTLLWDNGDERKPGRFLAVGSGDVTNAWSDDGKNWSAGVDNEGNDPYGTGSVNDARRYNGLWVMSGQPSDSSVTKLWWSQNGKIWSPGSGDTFGTTANSSGNDMVYFRDKWIVGGNPKTTGDTDKKISYSYDGKNWTYVNGNPFGTTSVATCEWIKTTSRIAVAVGIGGTNIYYSYDGIDWNEGQGDPFGSSTTSNPLHAEVSPAGVWIAIGKNGVTSSEFLWRSTDGINWELPTTPPVSANTNGGFDVGYFNGIWVATCYKAENAIWYSEDEGDNWIAATVDVDTTEIDVKDIFPPVSKNGKWVTGGKDNTGNTWITFTSTDGKTWTSNVTFNGVDSPATNYLSGAYGKSTGGDAFGSRIVIGGTANSTEPLYYSDDAETWTAPDVQPFGDSGTVNGVHWGFN